jgi:CheY-like chemotaxis protein
MKNIRILLIEDDGDDIDLLRDAFDMNQVDCSIDVVTEGDRAIPFLNDAHTLPDVIVMDLNLPKVHGREIMSQIKSDEKLARVPLVVLTTSSSKDDMKYADTMGVHRYLIKPNTIEGFKNTVRAIVSVANLP